jgi:hypothetical protein
LSHAVESIVMDWLTAMPQARKTVWARRSSIVRAQRAIIPPRD